MDNELNNNYQKFGFPKTLTYYNMSSHSGKENDCPIDPKDLSKPMKVFELQDYERPPGKEKKNLIKLEDLEHYVKTMSQSGKFKEQYHMLKSGHQRPSIEATKPENKSKNRYFDLLPYDDSRVVLQPLKDDPTTDFINANYVDAYNKPNGYICTQGPLEKTTVDFWRMVWQDFVCKIVMAANIIENGKKKCEKYWPDTTTKYGEIMVTLQSEAIFLDYTIRTFKVHKVGKSCRRIVRQYHFTGWPDHGVPVYPLSLLYMLKYMKNFQPNSKGPVVLHCSAGVGRSGTLMLLDSALEMAKAVNKVDVLGLLYRMRQQRVNLVETLEQYVFVYQTLVECLCNDVPCLPSSHLVMYYNRLRLTEPGPEGSKTKFQQQFEKLEQLTPPLPPERFIAAKAPDNKSKNRNDLILSPECGRPVLREGTSQNYINAVYVNGYGKENAFLATQFPLHETIKDFWQMVYETNSRTIVTLNEIPKHDESAPVFWPESGSAYHGSLRIDHTSSDDIPSFKIRQFKLRNVDESKKSRPVKMFHLSGMLKDDVAPPSSEAIVRLLAKVDKWQVKSGGNPIIVTCYYGVKGCGLYCAASYMADQIQAERELDIFTATRTVRLNRPQFVPKEQYRWLYEIACSLSTAYANL